MECLAFTCKIKRNKTFAKEIRLKKEALVNEAISWAGNTQKENLFIMTYGNLQTKGLRFHWVSMEKNII